LRRLPGKKKEKEDVDVEALLRPAVISSLSKYGYKPVIDEALKRFKAFMSLSDEDKQSGKSKADISSSLRIIVYSIAAKYGGVEEFEALKKYYLNVKDTTEKQWSLRSLGHTRDPKLIQQLLDWIKDSDEVRIQDKVFPFASVAASRAGRDICWAFLQKTFGEWFNKFEGGFLVQHLAKVPSEFVSNEKANEVEKFYSTIVEAYPACKRAMNQCVENIRKNANWREREIEVIKKWIIKKVK